MSVLSDTKATAIRTILSSGKDVFGALYPDDQEVYITALELVDSANNVADYFLWPLNPVSISKSENQIVSIKKTAGGISALSTETYMPSIVNLVGDFGRKFKILIGHDYVDFSAYNFSELMGADKANTQFSPYVKTGYGCIKILQKMIRKSNQLDQYGKPYFLYLYNLSFGESYLVKCTGQPNFSQNIEKNMIWQYNIQFETLASLDNVQNINKFSNLKTFEFSAVQKNVNAIFGDALTAVQSTIGI